MTKIYPKKLSPGYEVRVISPSRSLSIINEETRVIANKKFAELGLNLTFGKHVEESDMFLSSSIESRIQDLHEAFEDKNVKAIATVIGGFNANQLLRYLDWDLIKSNPKILCGFSDITALNNAIYAKTGLVNYSGPHYSSFGRNVDQSYSLDYYKKCLFSDESFEVRPSTMWDDRKWWIDKKDRTSFENPGWLIIHEGQAEGTILGANLCTFNLLQGTEYMPPLSGSLLFIEDDYSSDDLTFDRNLQSLIHLPDFSQVSGIVIGRFQKDSKISDEKLIQIINTKKELDHLPIIANVDFGHTDPKITFPIGGDVRIKSSNDNPKIEILKH